MKIQCYLCDVTEELDPHSQMAKIYRNHPLKTYLCPRCHNRITDKTLTRLSNRKVQAEDTILTYQK